jgi:fluoroacetyl-CoA thioesterase
VSAPGPAEVFRRYTEALDRGDVAAIESLIDDAFRLEGAGLDGTGKPQFIATMKAQIEAFPDYSENPTDIREEGDRVRFVAHVTGTQRGTLALPGMAPVEPTGSKIRLPGEPAWVQIRGGRLAVYHVDPVPGGGVQGILKQLSGGHGEPAAGDTGEVDLVVSAKDLASALAAQTGDSFPPVLATARMVSLMEIAAARVLQPFLEPGQLSVGATVEVSHTAATPEGARVIATARYLGRDGKLFAFEVAARDQGGEIGRGTHKRAIISSDRLLSGARKRNGGVP